MLGDEVNDRGRFRRWITVEAHAQNRRHHFVPPIEWIF